MWRRAKGHTLSAGRMVAACALLGLACGKIGYEPPGVEGNTAPDVDWRPPGDASSSDRGSMPDGVGSDAADTSDRGIANFDVSSFDVSSFDVSSDTASEPVDSGDSGRRDASATCPSSITT